MDLFWWPFNDRIWLKTYDRTTEPLTMPPRPVAQKSLRDLFGVSVGVRLYEWLMSHPQATPEVSRLLFGLIPNRDVVEPISDAIHYQDYIELLKVANTEFAIPVTSDFENVKQAWQVVVEMTEALAAQGRYPFNLTLNARFIRNSDTLLSPAFGNEHTCFIEILQHRKTPGWEPFSAAVAREWMAAREQAPTAEGVPADAGIIPCSAAARRQPRPLPRDPRRAERRPRRMFVNPTDRVLFAPASSRPPRPTLFGLTGRGVCA